MANQRNLNSARKADGVQARKSQATQRAILDCTIRCLMKYGYHDTTYIKISVESGFSRGAMRHHFPSRSDIMKATIEYLHEKRLSAFRKAAANTRTDQNRTAQSIDALWRHVNHPMFMVFIDLALAARRDKKLEAILRPAQDTFRRECYYAALELFPEWLNRREELRTAIDLSLYMMEGMVLDNLSSDGETARRLLGLLTQELDGLLGGGNMSDKENTSEAG